MVKHSTYEGGGKMASYPFTWDMSINESVSVPHSLNFDSIVLIGDRPIEVTIMDDTEAGFTGLGMGGGGYTIKPREFVLCRPNNGAFHGPKYQRTDIVRGYVVVLYKPT